MRVEAGTATQARLAGELIQARNALAGPDPGEASVTAAYLSGGYVYLVGGSQFVRYTVAGDGTLPEFIDAGYPRPVLLPPGVTVEGVLVRGTHTYVFAGPWYAKIDAGQELDTPLPLAPIRDNWGNLPAAVRGGIGGLFDGAAALYLFQGGSYIRYPAAQGTGAAAVRVRGRRLRHRPADHQHRLQTQPDAVVRGSAGAAEPGDAGDRRAARLHPGGLRSGCDADDDQGPGGPRWAPGCRSARTWTSTAPTASTTGRSSSTRPMLIAQSLTAAQKFEDAKGWYEYIFDPTEPDYWRFLPFLVVDAQALAADCQAGLDQLTELGADVTALAGALTPVLAALDTLIPAFQQRRPLEPPAEQQALDTVTSAASDGGPLQSLLTALPQPGTADPAAFAAARDGLAQRFAMLATLQQGYDLLGDYRAQIQTYLDDPFDPHAIAALRPSAYRRSVVMAYIDNLLDWGDMLFRQYTGESIDEARMLYVLAYDLLGPRPENLGPLPLPATRSYAGLQHDREDYDFVLDMAAGAVTPAAIAGRPRTGRPAMGGRSPRWPARPSCTPASPAPTSSFPRTARWTTTGPASKTGCRRSASR